MKGSTELALFRRLRAEAIKRDGYRCRLCGSNQDLRVHFRLYPRPPLAELAPNDMTTLCRLCADLALNLLVAKHHASQANHGQPVPTERANRYCTPIRSDAHAAWCRAEAERRYFGKVIEDELGMLVVEQRPEGFTHTDDVLRALSFYKRTPSGMERDDAG